jgi:hypothetical protein
VVRDVDDQGPYRDGGIHVAGQLCSTCVFRPGNLMMLAPGKLKQLVERNVESGSALQCHQTLPYYGEDRTPSAICRGFYDAHGSRVPALRVAISLDMIVFDPPDDSSDAVG